MEGEESFVGCFIFGSESYVFLLKEFMGFGVEVLFE